VRRLLFQSGRITVHSYTAMLYLGIVFGIFAQQQAATLVHIDRTRTLAATLLLLITALLGARLLFVVTHWRTYRQAPKRIWRVSEGGGAMYGGLILAVPLSIPLLAILDLQPGVFWDVASFTMLIGMIFARVGCLLNGCCSGRPANGWLALNLPDQRGEWRRRFPTQILEAAWGLVVLAGGITIWDFLPFPGGLFLYALGTYGAGRIVLEATRQQQDTVLGFRLHRALSALFVAVSLVGFAIAWLGA
jgi:phosphatidylglycerol---prolipoprotein diacylglyceryl transferase